MNEPRQFRTRTRHIGAIRWTGDNADALAAWTGGKFYEIEPEDRLDEDDAEVLGRHCWMPLAQGDWVVKIGEHFTPLTDESFRHYYEETPRE